MAVRWPERLRGALGGSIGIAATAFLSLYISQYFHLSPWLVAPVGASAVLVFAVPSSPLAQPWSVVGGNTVSAIIGLLASNLIPDPMIAASLAVGGAIACMFALRCLHPPGGAMALLVVLTHAHAPLYALFPAFTNSSLLVGMGLIYNNMTKRAYPHATASAAVERSGLLRITDADFAAALASQNAVIDIAPEDLSRLLQVSEMQAYRRIAGHLTCADIMSAPVHAVHFGTQLKDAWALMQTHDINALPVVDRKHRLHGLVTRADFLHHAALLDSHDPANGLKQLLTPTTTTHSDKVEVAGQIMIDAYTVARIDDPLDSVLPLFNARDDKTDKYHVLIVDADRRLTGIISASDVMRALYHAAA